MSSVQTQEMKWYIVRSQSNRERSVSERIIKESQAGDLIGKVGRVIVPVEKSYHIKDGKKIGRDKVMYPGYIFVETSSINDLKSFVKICNGAQNILSSRSGFAQSLKQSEVDRMIGKQQEIIAEQESNNRFFVGQEVQILDGPFSSFVGTIESINGLKVNVSVMIFGRKTPVDLDINHIEKK